MNELPPEIQELILKFNAKSMSRILFYTNEEAEAYAQGLQDFLKFADEVGKIKEEANADNEIDISSMGMDEFNQFMKEQLKGDVDD